MLGTLKPQRCLPGSETSEAEAKCQLVHQVTWIERMLTPQGASAGSTHPSVPVSWYKHALSLLCTWLGARCPAGAAVGPLCPAQEMGDGEQTGGGHSSRLTECS